MGRVAVLMAEGYEEGETLTIVDLLSRGALVWQTFCFTWRKTWWSKFIRKSRCDFTCSIF